MARRTEAARPTSRIHDGLVGARALVGTPYLRDPSLRQEYDAEIAPRTAAALAKIFATIDLKVTRALDLGAGTGAAGAAIRLAYGSDVDLVSVDQVSGPGIVVADLRRATRPAGVEGRFDLVVAAHLLNEMVPTVDVRRRSELVARWCRELLTSNGVAVLLEPALRETSRELLAVRDQLVGSGIQIVAPCFWAGACPALAQPRDWCHDSVAPQPASTAPRAHRVDFSYLVLRSPAATAQRHPTNAWRIVSDPFDEKGRLRVFACGVAQGRMSVIRLTRDRSADNAVFDQVSRGAAVTMGNLLPTPGGDTLRVSADTTVTVAQPTHHHETPGPNAPPGQIPPPGPGDTG